MTRSILAKYS